jgi:hypothetical protein
VTAVKKYLDNLNGEMPDMARLRDIGVPLKRAITICAERHKAPTVEPVAKQTPEPAPLPRLQPVAKQTGIANIERPAIAAPLPAVPPSDPKRNVFLEPAPKFFALSLLHTLALQMESGRADPTQLVWEGMSPGTAAELCNWIRSAHPVPVAKRN